MSGVRHTVVRDADPRRYFNFWQIVLGVAHAERLRSQVEHQSTDLIFGERSAVGGKHVRRPRGVVVVVVVKTERALKKKKKTRR